MNLDFVKKRIRNYLESDRTWPLLVDFQTKKDAMETADFFKVGDNVFPSIESFCDVDGLLKLDEFYDSLTNNCNNSFYTNITGFLKLLGEQQTSNVLKTIATTSIKGHAVVFTYQCKNYMRFSDPRILESGRLVVVDGIPDAVSDICLIPPTLSDAFPGSYQGMQKIGYVLENCSSEQAYIVTKMDRSIFNASVFHLSQLNNGYEILCDRDPRTSSIPQSFGDDTQWNYALQYIGNKGNWHTLITEHFGSENDLANALSSYYSFDAKRKWLYFIALSLCGARDNEYLQVAVERTTKFDGLVKAIYRSILFFEPKTSEYYRLYSQRKSLLLRISDNLSESVDYCKYLSIKEESAIYYLTDCSQPEKERIITWLSTYGYKYSMEQLEELLQTIYPDLANYLSEFRYRNDLLDKYFRQYKYQKVINRILPEFESVVSEQASKLDFVSVLKSRSSVIDALDVKESRAFFFDALGVEYLAFIQKKCNDYGLLVNISCARCELPSLTSCNKEFVDTLKSQGCPVTDIKELDEIKHHGEDNFDYEKVKTPIYLIRELEVIDDLLRKIRSSLIGEQYKKAIIVSDHGASRLAVLHNTENVWSMDTKGEHSGRCCRKNEIDSKPDFAIEQSDYWVLANYDRFRGGRKANVEVHGGASIEEVAIPIIEISRKNGDIEAFILDVSKVITLGAMEHAVLRIFAAIKTNNLSIRLNDRFYDAVPTTEQYVYSVDLPDCTKKGVFTFDIFNGNDVLATAQTFEIKKKGMEENSLFG